jgi:ketosteroid isomerase-like protein
VKSNESLATAEIPATEEEVNEVSGRALVAWLADFAAAVREQDYAAGRALFAFDVVSFGSINEMLHGLDALEHAQWRRVWSVTRGFDFDYTSAHVEVVGDRAWVVALWRSEGNDPKRGGWFERRGRATFVLARRAGRWLAVHSHFSLLPPNWI